MTMRASRITVWFTVGCAVFLFLPVAGHAQNWYTGITYEMSVPDGDLKNFVDETSYRGFGMTFRQMVSKNFSTGLFFGWNVFHKRTTETSQLNNGAITGTQDRTFNSFPMMLNAHWYLGGRGDIRPFLGLNAGGWIVLQRLAVGIYQVEKDSFEWGVVPEVGIVIPLSREAALFANGKYNYAFTGKGLSGDDFNMSYAGINVGFAWQQY
jgi:hypothetical protein